MIKYSSAVLLLASLCYLSACIHDPVYVEPNNPTGGTPDGQPDPNLPVGSASCDPDTVYFQNQVLPIFIGSCAVTGCHDLVSKKEGIALVDYSNIMKGIRPGDPNGSKYYKVLTLSGDDLMPLDPVTGQGFRLPADQIAIIEKWINQNAINNFCEECDSTSYTFSQRISPIFMTSCATSIGCHSSGSSYGAFTTYAEIKPYVDNGLIMDRVIVKKNMPSASPLADCELVVLRKWIEDGAPDN